MQRAGSDANGPGLRRDDAVRFAHRVTFLICSSTSFALAGIGVPGP